MFSKNKSKINWPAIWLIMLAGVAFGFQVFTAQAHAASGYTKVLPEGLSTNASTAKSRVQQLVSNDAGVQARIALDNGVSVDEVANATVDSVSKTKVTIGKTEDNTARAVASGAVVTTSYMNGQTVAAWKVTLKISETKTVVVKWKLDCSNPFAKKGNKRPPLRITSKSKTFTFPFKKSKTTSRTVTCPSGQQVTVTVVSTVKGKVRVKSLTKGVKLISQQLTAQIQIDVTNAIKVTCAAMPTPPAPPTPTPVPPNPTPTPVPSVDHPPHVDVFNTPAHMYVNGVFYVFIEAYDEDGDAVSVSTSASGSGTITLPTPVDVRWDNTACPIGKKCFRARVQASSTPGSLTLVFTVNSTGTSGQPKSETKSVTLPVVPDDFGDGTQPAPIPTVSV